MINLFRKPESNLSFVLEVISILINFDLLAATSHAAEGSAISPSALRLRADE